MYLFRTEHIYALLLFYVEEHPTSNILPEIGNTLEVQGTLPHRNAPHHNNAP